MFRKFSALTILILAVLVSLVACAPTPAPTSTEVPPTPTAARPLTEVPPTPTEVPEPGPSGELVVGVAADPVSMDPRSTVVVSGWAMLRHAYEPLVWRDDDMNLIPWLAESWSRPNATTYEFRLRKGVKFHNGEDFDAESVKYTIESIFDPDNKWVNGQFPWYISHIESVEIKDKYTVLLHLSRPSSGVLYNLSVISMLPPKAGAEAAEKFSITPIGTGPYIIVEYVSNSHMVIEAFDGYWGEKPKIKKITFRILPEDATRIAALESGEADLITYLPTDAIERVEANPNLKMLTTQEGRIQFVGLQAERPPFDDVRVRQALNYAIDKESLNRDFFAGYGEIATGPMHDSVLCFNDELEPFPYDPAKAKELLSQAGYPDGLKIKFGYSTGRYLMDKQLGEAIVGQLAKAGIECDAETAEWGTFFSNRSEGKYDAFYYGMGAMTYHADFSLQWFGRARFTKYENPTVDELLAEADAELDETKACELFKEAQEIIWDEGPWGWLFYPPLFYGANAKLEGFPLRSDSYFMLDKAYLSE